MPETLESIDAEIAQIEGQIATAMEGGGAAGPDYSAFFKSPGYDFRQAEGVRAIDRSASARGMLMSGGLKRELARYGQGLAAQEFGSYADRLASMAGIGQTNVRTAGAVGSAAAGQVGVGSANLAQTIVSGGQAQAEGIAGSNNALLGGFQGALGQFGGGLQNFGAAQGWWAPTSSLQQSINRNFAAFPETF